MIVTISGESGSGKTTVASLLSLSGFERIVTYTSRSPRHGERDAVDYMFKTRTQIEAFYASGILWEISEFCGNLYGSPLVDAKNNYCIVVDEIGALAYKAKYRSGCLCVLLTADKSTISRHLEKRGDIKSILIDRRGEQKPSAHNFDLILDPGNLTPQQCVGEILECCVSMCAKNRI